ncbi:putative Protein kinase domain containing protein [Blattamonas nauphoetae]|uniref:Protein kinase domain-containing protein n=1 Tax=Blattamonas nauphoetae TaxID=2049346 RepID=A0ABQ9YG57_9EUKA|nr:putative Protein kinase domain containing protein [Blattamonas nauphoetae]
MTSQHTQNTIDHTRCKWTIQERYGVSPRSTVFYCVFDDLYHKAVRYADQVNERLLTSLEYDRDVVDELVHTEGVPCAAKYTQWEYFPVNDEVFGVFDVLPETNLSRLMMKWKTEDRKWTDDSLLLLIAQLILPFETMHEKYIHRGIKPHYIFLEPNRPVRYTDFQRAVKMTQSNGQKVSAPYPNDDPVRPIETLLEGAQYDSRVDIWAIGLILHEIVYHKSIFGEDATILQITRNVLDSSFDIYPYDTEHPIFYDILRKMLDNNADRRPTARQLLAHPRLISAVSYLRSTSTLTLFTKDLHILLLEPLPSETSMESFDNRFAQCQHILLCQRESGEVHIDVEHRTLPDSTCNTLFPMSVKTLNKTPVVTYMIDGVRHRKTLTNLIDDLFALFIDQTKIGIFTKNDTEYSISHRSEKQRPHSLRYFSLVGILISLCLLNNIKIPITLDLFFWRQICGRPLDPRDLQFVSRQLFDEINNTTLINKQSDDEHTFSVTLPDTTVSNLCTAGNLRLVTDESLQASKEQAMLEILRWYLPPLDAVRMRVQSLIPESFLRSITPEELRDHFSEH